MKKIILLTMLMSFGLFSIAQTKFQVKNNLKKVESIMIKSSENVTNEHSTHPYLKPVNHHNNGTDDITVIDIGGAGNAYGLYNGGRTCVWAANEISSITFVHRMLAPPGGPGTGYIAYDVSIDGGSTWQVNNQIYEPQTIEYSGRYPQGLIYNPVGNADPSQAYFTYFTPVLVGGSWGDYCWGVNVLTTIPPDPTQNCQSTIPPYYQSVPEAFHIIPNGNTFVVEPALEDGFFVNYSGYMLFSNGIFTGDDYEYTQELFPVPITTDPPECTIACTKIAFSPDGQIGYFCILSNNGENTVESYGCYYPVLYKTTDGGETWDEEAINVQLGGPDGLEAVLNYMSDETLAQIFELPVPPRDSIPFTTAFDMDLVVDAYGNPHMLTTVGIGSQEWSIYTSATGEPCNGWIAMLHIYTTDDETWMCDTLYTPNTFRGEFGADPISEDNRPQISITPDGKKLFFSWIDTDQPTVVDNIYPDIYCVGYDVDHNVYTQENGNYKLWNVTTMTAAWMSAYMATQSYYVFDNGSFWEIPFVYQEMDINDPAAPVQYKYIQDFSISIFDFIPPATQTIHLEPGFQFISSHVVPYIPEMTSVVSEIMNDDLIYVRNTQGQTLRKIGSNWVNGIGDWIVREGYLVKITAANSFTIEGNYVYPGITIPVTAGFQFVSYFPNTPMNALDAFTTIIGDDLCYIRNSIGGMVRKIGPNWINGIGDCQPGEGYLVKMFADGEIFYPMTAKSSEKELILPTNFIFEGGNPAETVYTIYVKGLEIGDEVAAFDRDKMIGSVKINSNNAFENELPVFSTLINEQGYDEGNPIILKVWSENNIVSADFTMESIYDAYVSDVYPEGDGKYSVVNITKGEIENEDEALFVYPNPSEGIFYISLKGVNGDISIKVLDLRGKEYSNFELCGSTSTQLDLTELSAGVYFINFSGKNFSQVKKIVIK
jgi:hypothetical protein